MVVRYNWKMLGQLHSSRPPDIRCWQLASSRCDAQFGPLSAHTERGALASGDLWLRLEARFPDDVAIAFPAFTDRRGECLGSLGAHFHAERGHGLPDAGGFHRGVDG